MRIQERCRDVGGRSVRTVYVEGDGPVVVLVHGYTDSADSWRPVLELLSTEGRAAVALDLPGHGTADVEPEPLGLPQLDAFLRDSVALLDAGDGVILVGNSLGGLLALRSADLPQVRGVVALAPPVGAVNPALHLLPRSGSALAMLVQRFPASDRLVGWALGHALVLVCSEGSVDPAQRRAISAHLTRRRVGGLLRLGARLVAEIDAGDRSWEPSGAVPVTLWWGTRDRVCGRPPASVEVTFERGAPHCPQWTRPHRVVSLIAQVDRDARMTRAS